MHIWKRNHQVGPATLQHQFMTCNLSLHPVVQSDIADLQKMARQIWQQCFLAFLSQEQIEYMLPMMYGEAVIKKEIQRGFRWQWILATPDSQYFAEERKKENLRRVGYVSTEHLEYAMYLNKLYILPQFHRKGYASQVLETLKAQAKEAQKPEIHLNVNKHNKNALRAYQKAGFTIIKEECNDIGGGFVMDDYVMSCKINLDCEK